MKRHVTVKKRWNVQECDEQLVNEFVENLNITPLVASLLLNRGMTTVEAAREFYTLMHKRSTIRFIARYGQSSSSYSASN